ncbi:hypothetical protein FRC06_004090 [Ceratobasidium sp. 370]|nr:hypothetical protein FRC06_004090 [Ceratobasidium sp. 370]
MVQGVGFSISLKWASDGAIRHSAACTAQGGIFQVGDLGGALWSIAIAYHTFSLLFLLKKPSIWTTRVILGTSWTVILVLPIVGPHVIQNVDRSGHFYGVLGAWCWIGPGYQLEWFLFLYIWVFLAIVSSIVMYAYIRSSTGLLYLLLSGRLAFENGKLVWKATGQSRGLNRLTPWAEHDATVSFHEPEPDSGTDANGAAFSCSGLANVLLFIATRHSFIQQAAAVSPRVHVSTYRVTVMEDSRCAQTAHLHELSSITRPEGQDGISEKVDLEGDGSFKLK